METRGGKLEDGLLQAMKAIDNQVARAMQRTPAERDVHGVQKWEPYEIRVEQVAAFVLNALGNDDVTFDSMVVLAQAFTKALRLSIVDLGEAGLGKMRSAYCLDAMDKIQNDASKSLSELQADQLV